MKHSKKIIAVAAIGLLVSSSAMADVNWKRYKELLAYANQNPQDISLDAYIAGASSALWAANAQLNYDKQRPLYCPPEKLMLNPSNVKALLANTRNPAIAKIPDEMPLGMAIMFALRDAFPCQ
ncbi:hypothetical protein FQZ97_839270 [compost metagenome]